MDYGRKYQFFEKNGNYEEKIIPQIYCISNQLSKNILQISEDGLSTTIEISYDNVKDRTIVITETIPNKPTSKRLLEILKNNKFKEKSLK